MNAIKFIKDHGVEKAREELNKLPNSDVTHMTNDARMFIDENNPLLDKFQRGQIKDLICIEELKRLVESVDIIKDLDGIEGAKKTLAELIKLEWNEFEHRWIDGWMCTKPRLKQAIADYEQLFGNTETLGGEHV